MPSTEIELNMPVADGFYLPIGYANLEFDPATNAMTTLTIDVEKRLGLGFESRTIDCLADSDNLPFDDKPIAALVQGLALQWLDSPAGSAWLQAANIMAGEA